jgi:hypothetical protein
MALLVRPSTFLRGWWQVVRVLAADDGRVLGAIGLYQRRLPMMAVGSADIYGWKPGRNK